MEKIVIASTSRSAGKTSFIVGLGQALSRTVAYMKPLGDRLLYKKKRQWDHDASVVTSLLGLSEDPEYMTVGFEHSKLRYMYDEEGVKEKISEIMNAMDKSRDVLFVEAGSTLTYGISVHMDALALSEYIGGKLIVVVSGSDHSIIDDAAFLKRYIDRHKVNFGGIVINKVKDKEDFRDTYLREIEEMGIKVYGIIPFEKELNYFTADFVSERLFAKVIAGERGMNNTIKHIVVGAMSADTAINAPVFAGENKLVITGGDRSDMILASLETNSAAVVITNNILPPPNIISKASELSIPLLLVKNDTFETAKRIDDMEPLLTKSSADKAQMLAQLIKEHVNLDDII